MARRNQPWESQEEGHSRSRKAKCKCYQARTSMCVGHSLVRRQVVQDEARKLDRGQSILGFGIQNGGFGFNSKYVVKLLEGFKQKSGMI